MFQAYLVPIMTDVPFIIGPPPMKFEFFIVGRAISSKEISFSIILKFELHDSVSKSIFKVLSMFRSMSVPVFELKLVSIQVDYRYKLGCVVRMVIDSILPHAESGPNDHRKDAPPFI